MSSGDTVALPEVLTDLVSADVPDLDPTVVSARDIVNIRTSDEIFEHWRIQLGKVAKKLAHLNEAIIDREDARRRAIREELSAAALALRSQLKRRKSLPRRILKRLSLGAILRAPFLPIDPFTTGSDIAVDAGQAMVDLLELYADGATKTAEARYHHYLVFGPYIPGLESDRQRLTSKD